MLSPDNLYTFYQAIDVDNTGYLDREQFLAFARQRIESGLTSGYCYNSSRRQQYKEIFFQGDCCPWRHHFKETIEKGDNTSRRQLNKQIIIQGDNNSKRQQYYDIRVKGDNDTSMKTQQFKEII